MKYSHEITAPGEVSSAIDLAFRHAMEWPRGPVLLSLPMDVMEQAGLVGDFPRTSPTLLDQSVDAIAERLNAASNPAIVAGYEVDVFDAFQELSELAKRLGAPVFAEPLCSRAPVAMPCPNFAGDLLPASALIDAALGDFDVVLLVGADLILYPYTAAPLLPGKDLLYIGTDPSVAHKLRATPALGDVRRQLGSLVPRLRSTPRTFRRPPDFGRANRVARAAPSMGAAFVLDAVSRIFSDYTVVDEAVSLTPALKSLPPYHGHLSYFGSRSGQLGWGLAAAIGLGLRLPKVLVLVGDGALQYSVQGLWTLVREKIPVKVLVLNNRGYAILRSYSKAFHPALRDRDYLRVPGVDIPRLAEAYGMTGATVSAATDLEPALKQLREVPGPALLNVAIDESIPDLFS